MLLKRKKIIKAFTLVELFVVMTVIILITFIVFLGVQRTIARARDAERVSELNDLKAIFQLYYIDNGVYPTTTGWCSLEEPLGEEGCALFVKELYLKLEPYTDIIPGDPLYPEVKEGPKIYSYQYYTMAFGRDYKIHAELETGDFYEVYSGGGEAIAYVPPGEVPSRPGVPPDLITYPAESQGGYSWKLSGEVLSGGTFSGMGIVERGFEWSTSSDGPFQWEWTETGPFGAGYFENILDEFTADRGTCQEYYYRAKAKDIDSDWGYGNCVGGPNPACSFIQCVLIAVRFDPSIYEATEGQMDPTINIYVERIGGLNQEVTVSWRTGLGGTAIPGNDYTTFGSNPLVFHQGVTSTYFSVRITEDFLDEDDEIAIFELYDPSDNAELMYPTSAALTIHDNDGIPAPPEVETLPAFPIDRTGVTLNGNIQSIGSSNVTERGFEWRLNFGPYTSWTETPGPYPAEPYLRKITGLMPNTIYHYRAKAKNSSGWGYGQEQTFLIP